MISGSLNKALYQTGLYSCLLFALSGCSTTSTNPAPVSSATSESGDYYSSSSSSSSTPDYKHLQKGSYTGTTYRVKDGETLFYISYISGRDFRDLAAANNIPAPYTIYPGQTIRLSDNTDASTSRTHQTSSRSTQSYVEPVAVKHYSGNESKQNVNQRQGDIHVTETVVARSTPPVSVKPIETPVKSSPSTSNASSEAGNATVGTWRWPVEGKVINGYSASEGGNKGIDIAGRRGQPIYSTAAGRVVYAGNALRGYGNLIIIKHNDDYLSAYAHNETLLVKERQSVKAGEQIATMGSSGTSSVRLHFEIRYKGKSVNPLGYLPRR
ncbi:MAG: murein hydrolase activator NlpD [Plesiomonas sp.]|uniref:murein hydrolase activator NlpD n=1 Tax=Plesiomonas sp. TaxID=2486279 RepID=UPI003F3F65F2